MLIRAIHSVTGVRKLAHDFWVQVHALVSVLALREELALLRRVVIRALRLILVARREVTTPDRLFVLRHTGLAFLSVPVQRLSVLSFSLERFSSL